MKKIILVGTVHIDTKGPERLKKILDIEKPDTITIECEKEFLNQAIEIQKHIAKNKLVLKHSTRRIKFTPFTQTQILKLNKDTLMKFFSILYFEIITAKKYAEKNNTTLICIDKKEHIKEVAKNFPSNLNRKILLHFKMINEHALRLLPENFQKFIDDIYKSKSDKEKITKKDPTNLLKRNNCAVKKILEINAKKILHIGGANHIFNNSPNMYEMLKEKGENVKRLKLIEVDNIN